MIIGQGWEWVEVVGCVGLGRGCGWKSGKACLMLIVLVGMTALSLSGMVWDGSESLSCMVRWEGRVVLRMVGVGMGWWLGVW